MADNTSAQSPQRAPELTEGTIFISHSSTDERIAEGLTELLKNALGIAPEAIRCTSLSGHRLPIGANTELQLRADIMASTVFIALLSPRSLESTWVLFELGARWGAGKHFAPLLVELKPEQLPGPLPGFNAISCSSETDLHAFVNEVAKAVGLKTRGAEHYNTYLQRLAKESTKSAPSKTNSKPNPVEKKSRGDYTFSIKPGMDHSSLLTLTAREPVAVSEINLWLINRHGSAETLTLAPAQRGKVVTATIPQAKIAESYATTSVSWPQTKIANIIFQIRNKQDLRKFEVQATLVGKVDKRAVEYIELTSPTAFLSHTQGKL